MSYDAEYDVPADAKAVIISPAIVGDRYVQLTPVYTGARSCRTTPSSSWTGPRRRSSSTDLPEPRRPERRARPEGRQQGRRARPTCSASRRDNLDGQRREAQPDPHGPRQVHRTLADSKDELFATVDPARPLRRDAGRAATSRSARFNKRPGRGRRPPRRRAARTSRWPCDNLATALADVSQFVEDNKDALKHEHHRAGRRHPDPRQPAGRAQPRPSTSAPLALNNL